jgi:hypothetical protein
MFNKSIAIVVDDDPDLLNIFSEDLKMSGYHVVAIMMFLFLLTHFWHISISVKIQINIHY